MSNIDHSKLAEMLKLARASLNEEFLKKQSDAYQQWYVASNQTWKSTGTLLPPSNIKLVYPSEQDIVQRALEIYNTLTPATTTVKSVPQANIAEGIPGELFGSPAAEPVVETIIESIPIVEDVISKVDEPEVVEAVEEKPAEESKFKSLLTKWGGRGTY